MDLSAIGEYIQERRTKLQIRQEDLAELTGVTAKTIYMIENGKGNPSFLTLTKIAAVLGLEINVQIKKTIE
jgi:transcriptional regulator with XRE-family HTH domain